MTAFQDCSVVFIIESWVNADLEFTEPVLPFLNGENPSKPQPEFQPAPGSSHPSMRRPLARPMACCANILVEESLFRERPSARRRKQTASTTLPPDVPAGESRQTAG